MAMAKQDFPVAIELLDLGAALQFLPRTMVERDILVVVEHGDGLEVRGLGGRNADPQVVEQLEISAKYQGYIDRQAEHADHRHQAGARCQERKPTLAVAPVTAVHGFYLYLAV